MKSLFIALLGGLIFSSYKTETPVVAPVAINPLHAVEATDIAGLLSDGSLDVSQFVVNNGRIWAVCKLKGKLGVLPINEDCMVPITVGDCDGGIRITSDGSRAANSSSKHDCECLIITFEPCVVGPAIGPALNLTQQVVPCSVQDFPGDALCCTNRLIGTSGSSIYEICACMNRLL